MQDQDAFSTYKIIAYLYITCFICLLIALIVSMTRNYDKAKEIEMYENTYLDVRGATKLIYDQKTGTLTLSEHMIPYHLKSFDGGRIWYMVHYEADSLIIEGDIRKLHPGLLEAVKKL